MGEVGLRSETRGWPEARGVNEHGQAAHQSASGEIAHPDRCVYPGSNAALYPLTGSARV
ncbi:hypothetical protein KCP75_21100 [Salmonella enterica subsp. enterica]|nr:hypothetical protein KCP75_21100 [Salmonella enterica subsp. enterica]